MAIGDGSLQAGAGTVDERALPETEGLGIVGEQVGQAEPRAADVIGSDQVVGIEPAGLQAVGHAVEPGIGIAIMDSVVVERH